MGLLRSARGRALLSQERLAVRAGTSQQWLSRVERREVSLRLTDAERLFRVLGLRLHVQTAPLGPPPADPDLLAAGDSAAELAERVDTYGIIWRKFAGVPFLVGGRLAALAQGLLVRPMRLDLVVAESDVDAASKAMMLLSATRWSERHQDFGGCDPDLRAAAPRRWSVAGLFQLRIDVVPELPPELRVSVGDIDLPVVPLTCLLTQDTDIEELYRRIRRVAGERP